MMYTADANSIGSMRSSIFDFELTEDEIEKIAATDKNTRYYTPSPEALKMYATMELGPDL